MAWHTMATRAWRTSVGRKQAKRHRSEYDGYKNVAHFRGEKAGKEAPIRIAPSIMPTPVAMEAVAAMVWSSIWRLNSAPYMAMLGPK